MIAAIAHNWSANGTVEGKFVTILLVANCTFPSPDHYRVVRKPLECPASCI